MSFGGAHNPIQTSEDLRRIQALPRRSSVALAPLPPLAFQSECVPFSIQVQALQEVRDERGGLLPIQVGGGKTLISLLAPGVLGNPRTLLLLPASLVEKTEVERRKLRAQGWDVSLETRILSYEAL